MIKSITRFLGAFLFFLFLTIGASAQKKDTSTNSSVIIYSNNVEQDRSTNRNSSISPGTDDKNIIKLGVFSFFGGYEEIYYQRIICSTLSIEAGIGLTFHNYFEDAGYSLAAGSQGLIGVGMDTVSGKDNYQDKYEDHTQHICNVGFCMSLAPRIYFNSEGPEDYFVQPHLQYKLYNFTGLMADTGLTTSTTPTFLNGKTFPEYRKQLDFSIDFGYQTVTDKLSLEVLAGIGVRDVTEVRNNIGNRDNNTGFSTVNDFYNHTITYQETLLLLVLEFNIGYHF